MHCSRVDQQKHISVQRPARLPQVFDEYMHVEAKCPFPHLVRGDFSVWSGDEAADPLGLTHSRRALRGPPTVDVMSTIPELKPTGRRDGRSL